MEELSKSTIAGISSLLNPNVISDVDYGNFLETAILHLTEKGEDKYVAQLYGSKPDIVKEVFGNLLSLLIDAARLDLDADKLGIALTSAKMTGQRVNKLCETYANSKELIKSSLRRIGNSLPHVIDVNWRLDYCVKTNVENSVSSHIYHVQLSTIDRGKLEFVRFTCTTHQLQELVYKLKDAVRHVEKIANI